MLDPGSINSNDSQIRLRISANNRCRIGPAIMESHVQLLRAGDDVTVGQDETITSNKETRTAALWSVGAGYPNVYDTWRDAIDDGGDRLLVSIEQLFVRGGGHVWRGTLKLAIGRIGCHLIEDKILGWHNCN